MVAPFPPNPSVGDQITGPYGEVYEWDGVKWSLVPGGGSGGGASVEIGDTAPTNPVIGNLWWDTVSAQLFIWDSTQWVVVTNQPPSGGGGASGPVMGITDGSEAGPGEVGEYLSVAPGGSIAIQPSTFTVVAQLELTPGDWDIQGSVSCEVSPMYNMQQAQISIYQNDLTTISNQLPMLTNALFQVASPNLWLTFQGVAMGRINVTVATSVMLCVFMMPVGSGATGLARVMFMSARRIR